MLTISDFAIDEEGLYNYLLDDDQKPDDFGLEVTCSVDGQKVRVDVSEIEIPEETKNEIIRVISKDFTDVEYTFNCLVRPAGFTGVLYRKADLSDYPALKRVLGDVPFFPDATITHVQEGYLFQLKDYSVTLYVLDQADNEVDVTPPPQTWCELEDKLYENWFVVMTITENSNDYELAVINICNTQELARAKLFWDMVVNPLV